MKTTANKISSLLFILLGFMPLLFVLFFELKQELIRHQMKEQLEEQMLQTITVNNEDIHWEKAGEEIWVEGKMFDIKSFENKNGVTTFHGLFDDAETNLKRHLQEGLKKNSPLQKRLLTQLFQTLPIYFLPLNNNASLLTGNQEFLRFQPPSKLPSSFEVIPTPPPQG